MTSTTGPNKCEHCDQLVMMCDNNVWLEIPAVKYDEYTAGWTLMQLGKMLIASVGNPSPEGMGHVMHVHQPDA